MLIGWAKRHKIGRDGAVGCGSRELQATSGTRWVPVCFDRKAGDCFLLDRLSMRECWPRTSLPNVWNHEQPRSKFGARVGIV